MVAAGPGVVCVLTGGEAGVAGLPIGGGVGGGVAAAATNRADGVPRNRSTQTALAVVTETRVKGFTWVSLLEAPDQLLLTLLV
jgi:hypothetical protein